MLLDLARRRTWAATSYAEHELSIRERMNDEEGDKSLPRALQIVLT